MKRLPFIGLLLKPTGIGLVLTLAAAGLIIAGSNLAYAAKSGQLYDYLFGTGSSVALIEDTKSSIEAFNETLFGSPVLNQILLFVFWMFVGLVIYSMISGTVASLGSAKQLYDSSHYVNNQRHRLESSIMRRIFLRAAALLAWILFSIFFYRTLLPFSLLAGRIGGAEISSLSGIGFIVLGFTVLAVSIHLHVVLLRLTLLQPRVTGGWDDVLLDMELHDNHG